MKQRGRKSTSALALANSATHLVQRPAPPADHTAIQKHYWVEIVNTLPADWYGDENKALLGEYCRTLSTLAFINAQIDDLECAEVQEKGWLGLYLELVKRRESLVRVQLTQATKMRLTQQSRYGPRAAHTQSAAPTAKGKPWDHV